MRRSIALALLGFATGCIAWARIALARNALARNALADDTRRRPPDVGAVVPVEPREHGRLQWFGHRDHHLVPGALTINRAPYACDVEGDEFRRRGYFAAHLRLVHGVPPGDIADSVVLTGGQLRFSAE